MEQVIFYFFAILLVFAAGMVITVKNPVHAALFLVLAFFSSAAIWLLLEAEFLAIALVLVYVGAVMVLFLFVVMMLDVNLAELNTDYIYLFEIAAIILLVAIVAAIALTMRERRQLLKTQKPELQVTVQRQDRIRLVKMAAEKKQ
jgi:NADH-quinone oxidoreductase subunit J